MEDSNFNFFKKAEQLSKAPDMPDNSFVENGFAAMIRSNKPTGNSVGDMQNIITNNTMIDNNEPYYEVYNTMPDGPPIKLVENTNFVYTDEYTGNRLNLGG